MFNSMERPATSQHFSRAYRKGPRDAVGGVGPEGRTEGRGTEASAPLHLDSCKVQVKPGLAQQGRGSTSWEQHASLWSMDPSWGSGPEVGNRRVERWAEAPQMGLPSTGREAG